MLDQIKWRRSKSFKKPIFGNWEIQKASYQTPKRKYYYSKWNEKESGSQTTEKNQLIGGGF